MARRLIRDYADKTSFGIHNNLNFYLKYGRDAYLEMENTIKPSADFIVDGASTVDEIVDTILQKIKTSISN